jgi:molybdopterin converting factor small subunit
MPVVFMPTPLRKYIGGIPSVAVPGVTLRQLITNIDELFPGLKDHLLNPEDKDALMPGLAAVVDGEPTNEGLLTRLDETTEVHFLPAIAGGRC